MLQLRPNCEYCDKDLPANSAEAMICTYECTFCCDCVQNILENVCPNCGGGFEKRPTRPQVARRDGLSLNHHPASKKRVITNYTEQEITNFSKAAKSIPPKER